MHCLLLVAVLFLGTCWGRVRHRFNMSSVDEFSLLAKKRTTTTPIPAYYGCFEGSRLKFQTSQLSDNNDNVICSQFCKNSGYMFSATHKDICGCFSKHPSQEVSGPQHGADTIRVMNDGKKSCSNVCPSKGGVGQCNNEQNCCGGHGTYTVYQVGGVNNKRCSPSLMKELEKKGVDMEKSLLPSACLDAAAKRNYEEEHGITLDTDSLEADEDCDEDYKNMPKPWACCSPDCDWLIVYLCIDGTVVKCLDK